MKRSEENNTLLYLALAAAAALLVGALVSMKMKLGPGAPAPPPPPVVTPEVASEGVGKAPGLYQEELRTDAQRFGLGDVSLDDLATPLTRTIELREPRLLRAGQTFESPHLKVSARTENRLVQAERGGFRADHFILLIENKTDVPLAYRVDTRFEHPEKCTTRGVLTHNAIAIPARDRVERSECIYHKGLAVTVNRVETISLPAIGYYYVSQLVPTQIGLDARTAEGHAPPRPLAVCNLPFWREFATWGLEWADLVDFFARHDCQKYAPTKEYRFRTHAGPLPALHG